MAQVDIDGRAIEVRLIPGDAGKPWLVFLHEGLGSVSLWRDFPDQVARRIGARALIYSRFGYGHSAPLEGPRATDFMHVEALDVLPKLMAHYKITSPLLIGHSDGASIALINAGAHTVSGVVAIAPHVMVEPISTASIDKIRKSYLANDSLRTRLSKHHRHVDDAFLGWADVWLLPAFRAWRLDPDVAKITAPLLLIQGTDDEYGTLAQLDAIEAATRGPSQRVVLTGAGHSPHRDRPDAVLDAIASFAARVVHASVR